MTRGAFDPIIPNCLTCRFWEAEPVDEGVKPWSGWCHRYAPRPTTGGDEYIRCWPETYVGDWCGEYSEALDR